MGTAGKGSEHAASTGVMAMIIWRGSRLEFGNCGSSRKNDYFQRKMHRL